MLKTISVGETRRAARRQNFMIRATIGTDAGEAYSGRVRDLSAVGIKIELNAVPVEPMKRGENVTVDVRGIGAVKAEIAWRRSNWYGLKFARPIKPEKAIKPVGNGQRTPDHIKPIVVPSRSLKYVEGLRKD
ncbi:PilZ domain-containing protein [Sphingomonas tabacisoli]|uniref:PilZ domain-containing protein n=1 Tax=Sphingomonas tabacisoli TaxID=2249466 RepID=A0ABW4I0G1_9SPHN